MSKEKMTNFWGDVIRVPNKQYITPSRNFGASKINKAKILHFFVAI